MRFPEKHLSEDESFVFHLRTHMKALLLPALVLVVVCGAAGLAVGYIPRDTQAGRIAFWAALAVAALVLITWVIWPFLSWLTTTFTVTTERLITRTGVITRVGRDIPFERIKDVAYEQCLLDRILRSWTHVVSAASEQGQVRLHDVPSVQMVQLRLSELVRDEDLVDDEYEEYHRP